MKASIKKEGKAYVVKAVGATHLSDISGVVCLNPEAKEAARIYEKRFLRKPIFLARDYRRAYDSVLKGPDVVVLGMNGYTSLTPEQCRAWGVQVGGYEAACAGLLRATYKHLVANFPEIDIRFAHGASDLGVDGVIIRVANQLKRPQLGHSCPEFMFYVPDDEVPVYVASNKDKYAEAFIDSLHVLLACNGRAQAFNHDIDACFKKLKHVIPINVLRSISTNGGPPAIGPDGKIEDAVATFEQRVHMPYCPRTGAHPGDYATLVRLIANETVTIARQTISPEQAFAHVTV